MTKCSHNLELRDLKGEITLYNPKLYPYYTLLSKLFECKFCTLNQGCQYRTGGRTGLATGTIYFGYRKIPVYRFGFTAIFYIYKYKYIYMYVWLYVFVYIYIIINIKVYHKTFPQFRTNYS